MRSMLIKEINTGLIFALLIGISGMLLLTGCHSRPKPPEHLRIIFTSDTQGMFTPCGCVGGPRGGLERRATAIREARENAPGPVILIDTGNFSSGITTDQERTKAEYVTRAMAILDYDAVNVGRMDVGRPRLGVHTYGREGCPLTSAGFTYEDEETGERRFSYPTSIKIDVDGYTVGIIGSPLSRLSDEQTGYENDPTVTWEELAEIINRTNVIDGTRMIILVSDLSDSWQQTRIAASRFTLASVVIAGQSAPVEYVEEKSGTDIVHPIMIPRAVSWGRALGILDLHISPQGGIMKYRIEYVDLNENIEKDPAFADITEEYLAALNEPPSGIPEVRQIGYMGAKACQSCHGWEYEQWESTPHANAWATLEETGRLRESTCVPCHSTGYTDSEFMPERLVPYEVRSVGCEACHGPGEAHILYREWEIYGELTGEVRGEDLMDPIIPIPPERTCTACHVPPYDEGWLYASKLNRIIHD